MISMARKFDGASFLLAGLWPCPDAATTICKVSMKTPKAAWSEVINQYQRRADLIPNPGQYGHGARVFS